MTELKLLIDDNLIKTYGYSEIEKYLYDFISKLYVKISANEMLKGIQEIDLDEDQQWNNARDLAWKQEVHRYSKYLSMNL
jgi:hypothetical protein